MKALIELHFQHSASLKMYFGQHFHTPNETSKECIQFLNKEAKHNNGKSIIYEDKQFAKQNIHNKIGQL